jgi:hypothetical protein
VAVVLGVLALAISAPSASAKTPCWKQVQDEWVATARVSSTYPLHCYNEAIQHVPNDLAQYSSIIEDIQAARQRAARGVRTLQGRTPPRTEATPNDPSGGVYNDAIDKLGPTNSDSVPVPLLFLAGIAAIMVATGGVGLISRHLKARKTPA